MLTDEGKMAGPPIIVDGRTPVEEIAKMSCMICGEDELPMKNLVGFHGRVCSECHEDFVRAKLTAVLRAPADEMVDDCIVTDMKIISVEFILRTEVK